MLLCVIAMYILLTFWTYMAAQQVKNPQLQDGCKHTLALYLCVAMKNAWFFPQKVTQLRLPLEERKAVGIMDVLSSYRKSSCGTV